MVCRRALSTRTSRRLLNTSTIGLPSPKFITPRKLTYEDHCWAGLMGMYAIEDAETEAKVSVNVEIDIPTVTADRLFNESGALMYADGNCQTRVTHWVLRRGTHGERCCYAIVTVPPAQDCRHIAANARYYNLTMSFADQGKLIANDSDISTNYLTKSLIRYRGMEVNTTTIKNTLDSTKGKAEKWHFQYPQMIPTRFIGI